MTLLRRNPSADPNFLYFVLLLLLVQYFSLGGASKINQKIFVDVDSINFTDPQKNGFLVILNDDFVQNYLQDILLPTVYLTVQRLSGDGRDSGAKEPTRQDQRIVKIIYPESFQDGKVIKIDGLQTKSWYQICVEFENMNRHNETTGVTCKMSRTLDNFGRPAEHVVTDVSIDSIEPQRLSFLVTAELDFPAKLTAYLQGNHMLEAKVFMLSSDAFGFKTVFQGLQPATDYGSLCVFQEPSLARPVYTAMGRLVRTTLRRCFLQNVMTKPTATLPPPVIPVAAPGRQAATREAWRQNDHVIHEIDPDNDDDSMGRRFASLSAKRSTSAAGAQITRGAFYTSAASSLVSTIFSCMLVCVIYHQ